MIAPKSVHLTTEPQRSVTEACEKSEAQEYARRQDQRQAEGFGSLADKLRAAIQPKDE